MMKRKEKIVSQLTGGIAGLFKHNGVDVIQGRGKVLAGHKVEVTDLMGNVSTYEAGSVIIAAGSTPSPSPLRRSTTSTSSIPPAHLNSPRCPSGWA
jgi:dihydrolipoamide dehydrogenase